MLLITESWLNANINSAELGLTDYTIYRCDRSEQTSVHGKGGGVFVAVRNVLPSSQIDININNIEQIFVCLNLNGCKFLIGCSTRIEQRPF